MLAPSGPRQLSRRFSDLNVRLYLVVVVVVLSVVVVVVVVEVVVVVVVPQRVGQSRGPQRSGIVAG